MGEERERVRKVWEREEGGGMWRNGGDGSEGECWVEGTVCAVFAVFAWCACWLGTVGGDEDGCSGPSGPSSWIEEEKGRSVCCSSGCSCGSLGSFSAAARSLSLALT